MLADIITTGLNNPDCAFFVGQTFGISQAFGMVVFIAVFGTVYKLIDKLALEPLIEWIRKKIRKK